TAALTHIENHGQPSDHDSKAVVVDELVGAGLTSAILPWVWVAFSCTTFQQQLAGCLMVGCLFRALDLFKPWPAMKLDMEWHHPFSVIADDLVAAVYGLAILAAACHFVVS